jgi:hypothetical protein
MDQLDSTPRARLPARRGQRPLEIVDDRQDVADQINRRGLAQLAPLAVRPLAIVVELRRHAQQAIAEIVALLSHRRQLILECHSSSVIHIAREILRHDHFSTFRLVDFSDCC